MQAAEAIYRQILAANPQQFDALHLLGVIAHQTGHHAAAVELIERAIQLRGDFAPFHVNLGNALSSLRRYEDAIRSYQRAIALQPTEVAAHIALGSTLSMVDQLREAIDAYRQACALDPRNAIALSNLGAALGSLGHLSEAIDLQRQAAEINPALEQPHSNLATLLRERGDIDEAIQSWQRTLEINRASAAAHSSLLLTSLYQPIDPAQVLRQAREWATRHEAPLASAHRPPLNVRDPDRRLRIGYLSPDFRRHSVAFFLEPILATHDQRQVEVFCYADVHRPDAVTERFRRSATNWRDIAGMPDQAVDDLIRRDAIDVLIDLATHTAGGRPLVFARKPAPIQMSYLGYPATSGMMSIDYRITDAIADPPGEASDRQYAERLIRLPRCFLCYRPDDDAPAIAPLRAEKAGVITFGSFNAIAKISSSTIDLWSSVLRQVGCARLLLKFRGADDAGTRRIVLDRLAAANLAADRVDLVGYDDEPNQHLAAYGRVDIVLDPFPYNGTTTTCDLLWMGVPVVTLAGNAHVSRVGATLLHAVGLHDLVARTPDEFVHIAAGLAADRDRLAELRRTMRARLLESDLCDAPSLANALEDAFRIAWRKWCAS